MDNYYRVWKVFNNFFLRLDSKPDNWEDRITLFAAYLIDSNKKSTTVKSYVSAIKAILARIHIDVNEDRCLLKSLTRACKITKDTVTLRFPIQKGMLRILMKYTTQHFDSIGQLYLKTMYLALLSTMYYGLFRIGELTDSQHTVKACDVQIGINKNKMLFILRSSKTHGKESQPQIIKISSNGQQHGKSCPFQLLNNYIDMRPLYVDSSENFFVFLDGSLVHPQHFRDFLNTILELAGYDTSVYLSHSIRGGQSCDLFELGFLVETIKKLGRWKSNAVYAYLKC